MKELYYYANFYFFAAPNTGNFFLFVGFLYFSHLLLLFLTDQPDGISAESDSITLSDNCELAATPVPEDGYIPVEGAVESVEEIDDVTINGNVCFNRDILSFHQFFLEIIVVNK